MCLFPCFCLIFEIRMSLDFSGECLYWSHWLWIQAEQPGLNSGMITLLRARMQRIDGCVFVSSQYNNKIKVLLMKPSFNQYFNILLSCKHYFKLWRLSPVAGVIYIVAIQPLVLLARHRHHLVQNVAESSARTSGPAQSWQKPSDCFRWVVPFSAYSQGLFLSAVDSLDSPC